MSNISPSELRAQTVQELRAFVAKLTREYVTLKMQVGAGKDRAPTHLLRKIRVQIAQIQTILGERRGEQS